MGGAAASRRMVARAGWLSMASDEESRAYLQARLEALSRVMFWAFVVLTLGMTLMYWLYPGIKPDHQDAIGYMAAAGLAVLAVTWRVFLVRRALTMDRLFAIDMFYAVAPGLILALTVYYAQEFQPSAYGCAMYAAFVVFLRVIIVPSTGRRTAALAFLTFGPLVAVAFAVAPRHDPFPEPAFVAATIGLCAIVVALATIGSQVIYGLRRQVSEAMQLGQYTLVHKIGEGGMGAVYRARHTLLRRPTAIKLILPGRVDAETIDRFEREVQHTSQLTHPSTVAVFDYGRSPEGVFYYAMEYLDGIDLEQLVERYGPQPPTRVGNILVQICGALHEAHGRGIIHRDIKPGNMILCERGAVPDVPKVFDFGLVKEVSAEIAGDAPRGTGVTSKVILGTPAYVAPEVVADPHKIATASDIYSLGAVAYFLVTGRCVFLGKTAFDICVQHVTAAPVPPSKLGTVDIPAALEALIMRCLSKLPEERPNAAELATLLRAIPAGSDWSDDQALGWWAEFRTADKATAAAAAQTTTITVDLDERRDTEPIERAS